jgi:hypothetical protein
MADVFISYASGDRARAKAIADALAAHGLSVWWDRTIPPGKVFDEVIEEALDAAKCAVVLWSRASVASSWVKAEAAEAMRRQILVPAFIEDVKIPLEFRRLQAADLSQWPEAASAAQFAEFLRSIDGLVSRGGEPPADLADAVPHAAANAPRHRERAALRHAGRPTSQLKLKNVLLSLGSAATILLLVAGYILYDRMDRRIASEREARERAEQTAPVGHGRAGEPGRPATGGAASPGPVSPAAPRRQPETSLSPEASRARSKAPAALDLSGSWRDTTWGHVFRVVQEGNTFQYTASGTACRGSFRSSGSGSIRGTRIESTYRSTTPSEGRCSGTVSADGKRMNSTCFDSVCGQFIAVVAKQ